MPEISISKRQRERLRAVQEALEAETPYGHVRPRDALEYLLDEYDAGGGVGTLDVGAEPSAVDSDDTQPSSPDDSTPDTTPDFEVSDGKQGGPTVTRIPSPGANGDGSSTDADGDDTEGPEAATEMAETAEDDAPDPAATDTDAAADAGSAAADEAATDAADGEADGTTDNGEADGTTDNGEADGTTDNGEADGTTDNGEADEATDDGEADGTTDDAEAGGDDSMLDTMMSLLDDHADKWDESDAGEERYVVDLPDGTTESARTKDDVRALLFKHYR